MMLMFIQEFSGVNYIAVFILDIFQVQLYLGFIALLSRNLKG